jgi:cobalt/nickel transport system permease protein
LNTAVSRDELLIPYRPGTSLLHRLPAGPKLAAAFACIVLVALLPRDAWRAHALVGVVLVGAAALSAVHPVRLMKRLLLLEPFVIAVAGLALFRPGGTTMFLSMLAKSTLCLACMILLTATTRFSDLVAVLWRLRVPAALVTTLALMHRYLFVLFDEMQRMQRARRSRSLLREDRASVWRGSAAVAGQLFLRSSERAERVYQAMCARGWKH